jgi:hypothetical protein
MKNHLFYRKFCIDEEKYTFGEKNEPKNEILAPKTVCSCDIFLDREFFNLEK